METYSTYVPFVMTVVASVLVLVLAVGSKKLQGRNWLIAYAIITLSTSLVSRSIVLLAISEERYGLELYGLVDRDWIVVTNMFFLFGRACLGAFLFSIWSASRMDLDFRNLLFSFRGRIPRSVFWISLGILVPLNTTVGAIPFTANANGIPWVVMWIVYLSWVITSIWIGLALFAKRWHDFGRSGWMSLVMLIPIVGPLGMLAFLGAARGVVGPNQYGDYPLRT